MTLTYYVQLSENTLVKTYFAEITDSDPKFGFKRKFLKPNTHDMIDERAYYVTIFDEGVYEQSIKVLSLETRKLIRRERKYFLYDGSCLHEIERRKVLNFINKIKELAAL